MIWIEVTANHTKDVTKSPQNIESAEGGGRAET